MKYINYSGGAVGADMTWETLGNEYNVKTIAFSFKEHKTFSKNKLILTDEELHEGWERVLIASNKMNRYIKHTSPYVRKLLSRNWFQVKNSDAIFAIGKIVNPNEKGTKYKNSSKYQVVDGGTGYAVSMAIEIDKPVYVFDQNLNKWFKWNINNFVEIDEPKLTQNFAGIGTREINENGINAIKSIFDKIKKGG